MSKITRTDPNNLEAIESVVKAVRKNRIPVVFTDQNSNARNYAFPNQPEIAVVDLSKFRQSYEKQTMISAEASSKQHIGHTTVNLSEQAQNKLKKLQESVGRGIKIELEELKNWAGTFTEVVFAAHPKTKGQVTELIRAAKENELRARCAGSKHSWSTIIADRGDLVLHLDKLDSDYKGGAKIRLSDEINHVDVMSSVSTGQFMEFQLKNDINLPCNVIIDTLTIGGIVSTGSHGMGRDAKTVGDYVTRMRVFDSDGNLRVYTRDDADMMKAVSSSLGAFGIMYDITLRLTPKRKMCVQHKYITMKSLFDDDKALQNIVESNWAVQALWIPYNSWSRVTDYDTGEDEVLFRLTNDDTSDEPEEDEEFSEDTERLDYLTQASMDSSAFLYLNFPSLTPVLCDAAFSFPPGSLLEDKKIRQPLARAVHYRKDTSRSRFWIMEFAFDIKNDYNRLLGIIKIVKDTMLRYNAKGMYPLNNVVELRWMAYSDSYLTPAVIGSPENGGSGQVVYIDIISYLGTKHCNEFCIDVAEQWMQFGGVPHLAKQWQFIPGMVGHIRKVLGENIEKFKKQLEKSNADPTGVFMNKTICQLLNI